MCLCRILQPSGFGTPVWDVYVHTALTMKCESVNLLSSSRRSTKLVTRKHKKSLHSPKVFWVIVVRQPRISAKSGDEPLNNRLDNYSSPRQILDRSPHHSPKFLDKHFPEPF